jgi:hypothetical protein
MVRALKCWRLQRIAAAKIDSNDSTVHRSGHCRHHRPALQGGGRRMKKLVITRGPAPHAPTAPAAVLVAW